MCEAGQSLVVDEEQVDSGLGGEDLSVRSGRFGRGEAAEERGRQALLCSAGADDLDT